MKRRIQTVAGLIAAVAVLLLLVVPKLAESDDAATGEESNGARPVRVVQTERSSLENTLRLTGTLRADETVEIRAEIAAKVTEILFSEGEPVDEGQLLVRLDDEELRAELEQVEANLAFARREEERQRRLVREGSTTERLLEEAANRREVLEANHRSIRSRLAKTELRAPFSGTIGLRHVSPGSLVQPETRVATLQRLQPLKIDFSAPERYLDELTAGLRFELRLTGDSRTYTGEVYAREPSIDPDTRTVALRGRVDNPERRLLPGAFAEVHLNLGEEGDVILLPAVAVVPGTDSSVFVVENGHANRREVTLGRRTRNRVQISEGLEAGETVVVAGTQNIRDGEAVAILGSD